MLTKDLSAIEHLTDLASMRRCSTPLIHHISPARSISLQGFHRSLLVQGRDEALHGSNPQLSQAPHGFVKYCPDYNVTLPFAVADAILYEKFPLPRPNVANPTQMREDFLSIYIIWLNFQRLL